MADLLFPATEATIRRLMSSWWDAQVLWEGNPLPWQPQHPTGFLPQENRLLCNVGLRCAGPH